MTPPMIPATPPAFPATDAMIQRMAASALFAGFAAGLLAAALHFVLIEPVLLQAEQYESGLLVHVGVASGGHDHAAHDPEDHDHAALPKAAQPVVDPVSPAALPFDWGRHGLTLVFHALVYCGYGLMLVAGFALAEMAGQRLSPRAGLIWGLAGFIAVQFAPAAGLPPELPGMAGGDLVARQVWWVGTVLATGAGLALIGFGRSGAPWGLAVVLIAGPHLIGAPHPAEMTGPVPPELAALFAGRTLGVGMAVWLVLGLVAAHLWGRIPQWQRR